MTAADEINTLTNSLSGWEFAAYVTIAAVAIGVAGEVIHDFTSWFKSIRWWRDKGNKYSAILLVVALFAELFVQIKENSISERIIAVLEQETAKSQERTAEIMKETAWRQFTPDQISKLRAALSTHSGRYIAAWIANDPESLSLAIQFVNLLDPLKWDMVNSAKVYPTNLVWGVRIPEVAEAMETVQVLRNAFNQAGITFSTEALPPESMSYGPSDQTVFAGRAVVLFGSKTPTFTQPPN